jgi:hypothetical protein
MSGSDPNQSARFIEAARAAEADETGAEFERLFLRIALQQTTNTTTTDTAAAAAATPPAAAPWVRQIYTISKTHTK